jgi:hypothetical protein
MALSSQELYGIIYLVIFRSKYIDGRKDHAVWKIDVPKRAGGTPYMFGHAT